MSDIKLPRLPNVQVPRIDADVSLIDIRVLAKWCQRVATEYARAAVEADRADRAQQDAPTDAEWPAPHSVETVRDANGRARRGSDLYTREAVEEIIAIELGRARFDPAQDAERERTQGGQQHGGLSTTNLPETRVDTGLEGGGDCGQQNGGDAALHPNHIPDLRYILAVMERLSKSKPKDGELSAAVNGMRYVVSRTEDAARAQRAAAQGDGDGR